jgi:hypothetical protein
MSLSALTNGSVKPWLNGRLNDLTVDDTLTINNSLEINGNLNVTGGKVKVNTVAIPSASLLIVVSPDPGSFGSATAAMVGLGGVCSYAPKGSTSMLIYWNGQLQNLTLQNVVMTLRYGTGAAPAKGAAVTGTQIGAIVTSTPADGEFRPFSFIGQATGLVIGTAYWFDLTISATSSTSVSVQSVVFQTLEVN